ncbi:hypothetical protein E2562_007504 [Oryza meyeriana var. granulata]|uniref:JmjC domain-containing protein n=1 Tax=Oryza meyeriana var. granulata TaxID=110450 RepID=A0A6G1DXK7_9ORYZ|nr:hypothetical protein E2562_007504 [Oryza meyeriana var. granulata]
MRSSPPPAPAAAELVPPWLKSLPIAPEFRPTAAEFADPVAYIHKIEAAAAPYGICKVVPPFPPPPKKATLSNLSRSFAALHPDDPSPSFPSRHQQLGLCPRRPRPAVKPVWRSSHRYTLPQFESKANAARKSLLARLNVPASKQLSPVDYEVLFWRTSADRPIVVEYASDISGSGFSPCVTQQQPPPARAAVHVGETAWNMRGVARSPGSLLQFMPEDVPGVTTPMLYIGMMFSWFAWHVEDHELHSLNYMHLGAAKTWYGVPRDATLAFEEVVREHGYGGEVNPLETFATLGRKTTVMSPEVLVDMGIPCCRLVQNAGEFVVTFPGSYHCGFSHGFNCGEASNIATPEWLRIAKEAAIRRASINCPPMVSHYQLLYELALSMRFREPSGGEMETRSSRLKEKKKCEGEQLIKKMFIRNVIEDNELLSHLLNDGSSCIILPANAHDGPVLSAFHSRYQSKMNSRISHDLCSREEAPEALGCLSLNRNGDTRNCISLDTHNMEGDKGDIISTTGLSDQGLLSCVTCGILSFSCVAVLKPRDCTARYLMSADSSSINNQLSISGGSILADALTNERNGVISRPYSERCCNEIMFDEAEIDRNSALDLLAFAYGGQSDSEEDPLKKILQVAHNSDQLLRSINESQPNSSSNVGCVGTKLPSSSVECQEIPSSQNAHCLASSVISNGPKGVRTRNKYQLKMVLSEGFQAKDMYSAKEKKVQSESSSLKGTVKERVDVSGTENDARCNRTTISVSEHRGSTPMINSLATSIVKPDKDSSRMHVFCLEHAIEVEKQLHALGGSHIILLCRPEYPKIEAEARLLAEEMGVGYDWKDIHFKEANMEDRQKVQEVLRDEEAIPTSKSSNRREEIPVEETNTKRPKHSEEDNLRALKSAAEVVARSPAGTALRSSSRIASRANKLKSKMEEEDGPSSHPASNIKESHASGPKSNIQEQNANSASHLPKQKTEAEAKKQTRNPKAPKQAVEYPCDIEGCSMSFRTKRDLSLHKSDICPVKGCGKKFFSHKYLLQHRKVHTDDRPLTCPWEGCNMAFKWPWARTEHLRVHTGDRPYVCHEPGCAQTFRFVSDFSRHKRKTGHSAKKKKKAKS